MSVLRAELADWIERVRTGEEVVVTDRGTPVVRPQRAARPTTSGASRARAQRPVSELVSDQRR